MHGPVAPSSLAIQGSARKEGIAKSAWPFGVDFSGPEVGVPQLGAPSREIVAQLAHLDSRVTRPNDCYLESRSLTAGQSPDWGLAQVNEGFRKR